MKTYLDGLKEAALICQELSPKGTSRYADAIRQRIVEHELQAEKDWMTPEGRARTEAFNARLKRHRELDQGIRSFEDTFGNWIWE